MACQAVGQVPASLISWAASVIGIPCAVVAAQITEESGGNPQAVSSTGAEGVAQFEPGTWTSLGCAGTPQNVNDAMKCYATYMYELVQQYHGNVADALAAYNAGPGNLAAGAGYASTILAAAGQPGGLTASGGTGNTASLASYTTVSSATCLWQFPGLAGVGAFCVIQKATLRHLVGGLLIGASAIPITLGVLLIGAFAFRASGAQHAAGQAIETFTPAGRAYRRYAERDLTRRGAPRTPARQKIPRSRVRSSPARRPKVIEGTLPDQPAPGP
jgi:Transglycosylase SLT domain